MIKNSNQKLCIAEISWRSQITFWFSIIQLLLLIAEIASLISYLIIKNDSSKSCLIGFSPLLFIAERLVLVFSGYITYWICRYKEFPHHKKILIWLWLFPIYGTLYITSIIKKMVPDSNDLNRWQYDVYSTSFWPETLDTFSPLITSEYESESEDNNHPDLTSIQLNPTEPKSIESNKLLEKLETYFTKVKLVKDDQLRQQYLIGQYGTDKVMGKDYLLLTYNFVSAQDALLTNPITINLGYSYVRKYFRYILFYKSTNNNDYTCRFQPIKWIYNLFAHDYMNAKYHYKMNNSFYGIIKYIKKHKLCSDYLKQ